MYLGSIRASGGGKFGIRRGLDRPDIHPGGADAPPQPELTRIHTLLLAHHLGMQETILKRQESFDTQNELQKLAVELEAIESKTDRRRGSGRFELPRQCCHQQEEGPPASTHVGSRRTGTSPGKRPERTTNRLDRTWRQRGTPPPSSVI